MNEIKTLFAIFFIFVLAGCASRPRLYPNAKYEQSGPQAAEADINECMAKADKYLEGEKGKQVASGAGKGAIMGGVIGGIFTGGLRGAVRGAAAGGVIGGTGAALSPKRLHQQYVNTCLGQKGYHVLGWD